MRGTLLVPPAGARIPAALILGGSGPTDRNGNQPTTHTDNLKLLAHALFAAGVATLRIDKRGIGASGPAAPAEADLRLDTYVADAKAWLAFLRAQERVGRMFIVGHSEGALIASLAAQGEDLAGARADRRDRLAARRGAAPPADRDGGARTAAPESLRHHRSARSAVETTRDVPAELAALLRPSVQPFLISSLTTRPRRGACREHGAGAGRFGARPTCRSRVEDAHLLVASRAGIELAIIDGMNHTLKVAPPTGPRRSAPTSDPDLPLAPALAPTVSDFIRRHAE